MDKKICKTCLAEKVIKQFELCIEEIKKADVLIISALLEAVKN